MAVIKGPACRGVPIKAATKRHRRERRLRHQDAGRFGRGMRECQYRKASEIKLLRRR
jgi:hypothetical protein